MRRFYGAINDSTVVSSPSTTSILYTAGKWLSLVYTYHKTSGKPRFFPPEGGENPGLGLVVGYHSYFMN